MKKLFLLVLIIGFSISYPLMAFAGDDDQGDDVEWSLADDDDDEECSPLIASVDVVFGPPLIIIITGECFDVEGPPVVDLGGALLSDFEYTDTEISTQIDFDPTFPCVLTVCPEGDDDGQCDRFRLDEPLSGPTGGFPISAHWGTPYSQLAAGTIDQLLSFAVANSMYLTNNAVYTILNYETAPDQLIGISADRAKANGRKTVRPYEL